MSTYPCRYCRGTGKRRIVGANLPIGGAEVVLRVARGQLSKTDHVVVFLRDCARRQETDADREGLTLLVPQGKRIADLEWPHVPDTPQDWLPSVVLWGVDIQQEKAEAACRALVRFAYDRVLLYLGAREGVPRYTVFEAGACETA